MVKISLASMASGLSLAMMTITATPSQARPVKTPRVDWTRNDAPDRPTTMLRHNARRAAILMTIENGTPGPEMIDRLIASVSDNQSYKLTREWSGEQLERAQVQRGFSFVLDNGQRGVFAIVWRPTRDGKVSAAAYATTDLTTPAKSQADFLLVRSFSNQLRRGATPGQQAITDGIVAPTLALVPPPPQPPVSNAPVIAVAPPSPAITPAPVQAVPQVVVAPSAAEAMIVQSAMTPAMPPVKELAVAPPVIPSIPAPSMAAPPSVAAIPVPVATPKAVPAPAIAAPKVAPSYPFTASPGAVAGAKPSQISAIIYAPLEFSEIYVLFKDGSFHENLPVALEDWNVGASKKSDPDSWGKWSKTTAATDYELRYAADDKVTITGAKVAPAAPGLVLNGTYATESAKLGDASARAKQQSNTISFSGTKFTQNSAAGQISGQYRVDGYTIILTQEDGRATRLPFFIIPPEEGETDELIWLGNEVRVKQNEDDQDTEDAPVAT